jgi:hypothetical protein
MMSGYSGTPLAKKLGMKTGSKVRLVNAPDHYFELFSDLPEIIQVKASKTKKDLIHYFTTEAKAL